MPTRPERGHGPAQPVRLAGAEPGCDDGDAHGLFLEERHAEGLAENPFEFVPGGRVPGRGPGRRRARFPRAGADRDAPCSPWIGPGRTIATLDHEIVEAGGFQPRQHRHLRPALDLEDAERIGARDHGIDARILPPGWSRAAAACRNASPADRRRGAGRTACRARAGRS